MKIMSPHYRARLREIKWLVKSCREPPNQAQGQASAWAPSMRLSLPLESTERREASSTARKTLVGCRAFTSLRISFVSKHSSASPTSLTARVGSEGVRKIFSTASHCFASAALLERPRRCRAKRNGDFVQR